MGHCSACHAVIKGQHKSLLSYIMILMKHPKSKIIHNGPTCALSSDSANAFEDDTSRLRPTEEAVRSNGSSISFVGLGWRLLPTK